MEELPIEKNIQKIMEDTGMAIHCQEAITMLCQKYPGMDNIISILIDDIKIYQTNEICHFLIDASNGKFVDNSGLKIGIYEKLYMLTHIKPKYFIDSINNALFEFTKSNSKIDKLQYLAYTLKNYGKNAIDLYLQKHPEYQNAYDQLISICQPIEDVLTNYNHSNKHYLISCMKDGENSYYHSCWIINTLSNYCAKLENNYLIQTDMQISEQASYLYMTKKFGTELIDICHPYILERRIFDAQKKYVHYPYDAFNRCISHSKKNASVLYVTESDMDNKIKDNTIVSVFASNLTGDGTYHLYVGKNSYLIMSIKFNDKLEKLVDR